MDRKVIKTVVFKGELGNSFKAITEAKNYLREEGYTFGSMCGGEPIGFADSNKIEYIAKWRNIDTSEYNKLDGIIESEDFREGDVTISYFE